MSAGWDFVDAHQRELWWFVVVLLGVGFTAGSSTEHADLRGAVGIALLITGCVGLYRRGVRVGRNDQEVSR